MVQNPLPLMKCGHTAQGRDFTTKEPVCVVCSGKPEARQVAESEPDLTGRLARCSYSRPGQETHSPSGGQYRGQPFPSTTESSIRLSFFKHLPDQTEDSFYCGCWGWD